jgi:hypothetical protein
MRRTLLLLLFIIIAHFPALCQQVIGSAGGYHHQANKTISWTLGEIAIVTLESENYILTQGFQQGSITITAIIPPPAGLHVNAFPNPAGDFLRVQIDDMHQSGAQIRLFDLSGRLVIEQHVNASPQQVNLTSLSRGTYLLKVYQQSIEIASFKIIKH